MNKVFLVGRLGKDAELKVDNKLLEFSLATSRSFKNKDGEYEDATDWHNLKYWGKDMANRAKYFKKGTQVAIDGELRTEVFEVEGSKRYKTVVYVRYAELLSRSEDTSQQSQPPVKTSSGPIGNTDAFEDLPF